MGLLIILLIFVLALVLSGRLSNWLLSVPPLSKIQDKIQSKPGKLMLACGVRGLALAVLLNIPALLLGVPFRPLGLLANGLFYAVILFLSALISNAIAKLISKK